MVELCCYDGLPCGYFIVKLGYGACYVKGLDGKIRYICSRFVLDSSVILEESFVPKKLIPK